MGDGILLGRSNDLVLALQTAYDPVDCVQEILCFNRRLVAPCSGQGRLVAHIRNVGSGEARSVLGKEGHIEILGELEAPQVYFEYLFPLLQVRKVHMNLAVEPARTEQRLVEDVSPVGGGKDDDSRIGIESVHLGKKLVQSVFPLVVGGESAVLAPCTAHGVNLVYEDDARGCLLSLTEEIPHARSTHADEHLDEIRA